MNFEDIALHKGDPIPLYRQIAAAIRDAIMQETLAPGERLPPIRTLALVLGVSQVTASQAYDLLLAEGAIGSHVGRGTFVLDRPADLAPTTARLTGPLIAPESQPAEANSSNWLNTLQSHVQAPHGQTAYFVVQEALRHSIGVTQPIYMSRAIPDPALFPIQRWHRSMRAAARSFAQEPANVVQYGSSLGDATLRERVARTLRRHAFEVDANEILLTSGTQQGLDLIARTLLTAGDTVFVEEASYMPALDILGQRQVIWQPLPLDQEGIRAEALPALAGSVQARPRLLYTNPTGQSPTGVNLSPARRRALAEMASRYNLLLVADEAFHELYLDGNDPPPALHSFAEPGRAISLVSFNKTIFPGVRMGCIVAAEPIIELLAETKALVDREVSVPLAHAVARHISSPEYARELRGFRMEYRARRDLLLGLLESELAPLGCRWRVPGAGFSLLLSLPPGIAEPAAVEEVARQGVIVMPGYCFAPTRTTWLGNTIRLSYGDLPPEQLEAGVQRIARALHNLRERHVTPVEGGQQARIVL